MPIKFIVTAMSALGFLSLTSTAYAGGCVGPDCALGVKYIPSNAPRFDSMTVSSTQPMGHLKSVDFQRAPHVSIMRVHGLAQNVGLSDAPVKFTEGCHPTSTRYCRQGGETLIAPTPPLLQAPLMQAPARPAPMMQAPIMRQHMMGQQMMGQNMMRHYGPSAPAPANDGYWEKVSGPTNIGGALATQVICRRAAPRPAPQPVMMQQSYQRIVRPIVYVGVPVPTPLPAPYCGRR